MACIKLWLHLLMAANHKKTETIFNNEKMIINRGQLICGRLQLEAELGINQHKIYRLMELLEKEQLIEQRKTNAFTIVSIVNYESYQNNEQPVSNQRATSEQPVSTSKALKNDKNDKNRAFTPPTHQEVSDYCISRKNTVDPDKFHDFYTSKGWMIGKNKMKDWKAAVRTWETEKDGKIEHTL